MAAVILLAALTGASNHSPAGRDGGQQVAAGAAAAADILRSSPRPAVTTTSVAPAGTAAPVGGPVSGAAVSGAAPGAASAGGDLTATPSGARDQGGAVAGGVDGTGSEGRSGTQSETETEPDPVGTQSTTPAVTEPTTTSPPDTAPPVATLSRRPGIEAEVLALTNADRGAQGVAPVSRDGCMDAEASAWAREMADAGVMSHSPSGGASVQGCRGAQAYWGDNVGHWLPCYADDMEAWWMNSPSHRPHILDPVYEVVGIGVWSDPSGRCWFQVFFGS